MFDSLDALTREPFTQLRKEMDVLIVERFGLTSPADVRPWHFSVSLLHLIDFGPSNCPERTSFFLLLPPTQSYLLIFPNFSNAGPFLPRGAKIWEQES